ncbi:MULTISPECIES: hypothetical protein [Legionella]|uniref:Uncharacterized protein n=1 Tax=Legionella drozanskii LLAP-1 TaxID=1212489 RepID=A0A0W0T877_9GAMM|nr:MULTISPECIES: hypothetical protein [Legionella]KTC91822.1 hypothetical protein Ldro_0656 [Legionella drozanskii LLAP-1]
MFQFSFLAWFKVTLFLPLLFLYSLVYGYSSIELFFSNNTDVIQINEAYSRLVSASQKKMHEQVIAILQRNHIEQGTFKDALGMYQITTCDISADNSSRFISSSQQPLSKKVIFSLSRELVTKLNQESIAVFFPNNDFPVSDTTLHFTTVQPTIVEALNLIKQQLPINFSQAFSMYLDNECEDFDTIKVVAIEWLGQRVNADLIRQAFPQEIIHSRHGEAYMVYRDGSKKSL